jgi:MoxR-like ATPase
MPDPFLVMATQNPIESEGTFPLPEAQVDRFMMKVVVSYPTSPEEHAIVERALEPPGPTQAMLTPEDLIRMQATAPAGVRRPGRRRLRGPPGHRDPRARARSGWRAGPVRHVRREPARVHRARAGRAGAGVPARPRLRAAARRAGADPGRAAAPIVLSYEALADDVDPDTVIAGVLGAVPVPDVALQDR